MTLQADEPEQEDTPEEEPETPEVEEEPEAEAEGEGDGEPADEGEGEGKEEPDPAVDPADAPLTVTIGAEDEEDEEPPAPTDPKAKHRWVQQREEKKALQARVRELEAKVSTSQPPPVDVPKVGPKPTMEDEDVRYNLEKYDAKLLKWNADKQKVDEHQRKAADEQRKAAEEAKTVYDAYERKKAALGKSDFQVREKTVIDALSIAQQNVLLRKTKETAAIVYALSKNPAKLAKLAALDPYDFHVAILAEEQRLNVTDRKKTPDTEPETPVRGGTVSSTSNVSKELERLENSPKAKRGDRSEIIAYKAKLKEREGQKKK